MTRVRLEFSLSALSSDPSAEQAYLDWRAASQRAYETAVRGTLRDGEYLAADNIEVSSELAVADPNGRRRRLLGGKAWHGLTTERVGEVANDGVNVTVEMEGQTYSSGDPAVVAKEILVGAIYNGTLEEALDAVAPFSVLVNFVDAASSIDVFVTVFRRSIEPTVAPPDDADDMDSSSSSSHRRQPSSVPTQLILLLIALSVCIMGMPMCVVAWRRYHEPNDDTLSDEEQADFMSDLTVEAQQVVQFSPKKRHDTYRVRASKRSFVWDTETRGMLTWGSGYVRRYEKGRALGFVDAREGVEVEASRAVRDALDVSSDQQFKDRVAEFRARTDTLRVSWQLGRVRLNASRVSVVEDAWNALRDLPAEAWRQPFFVTFDDEAGLDAGGLSREFFELLSEGLFDSDFGVFTLGQNDELTYQLIDDDNDDLERCVFAGKITGKALLEGHHFSASAHPTLVLLKHIVCEPVDFDDLQLVDYHLWKSLASLKDMDADMLEMLDLTFSVDRRSNERPAAMDNGVRIHFQDVVTTELIDHGAETQVTPDNLDLFLRLRFKNRVFDACRRRLGAFLDGVYAVLPPEHLLLLSARELELVLCGVPELDVDAWMAATCLKGDFETHPDHPVVAWFWEVVASWSHQRRAHLLQWACSTSRVPVRGFNFLPGRDGAIRKFTLRSIPLHTAVYPRAHTCFNRVDLPLYETKDALERALDFVITHFASATENQTFSME